MDDRKNHGLPGNAAGKNSQIQSKNTSQTQPPFFLNRSMTVNSSAAAAAANSPCAASPFQRNGSVKGLHGSSFASTGNSFSGKVWKLRSIFDSPKCPSPTKTPQSPGSPKIAPDPLVWLPGTEDRVVIFFTSLRGIRRTFQDCHSIRLIFRGFRVNIDERDISMDVAYRKELQKVLGEKNVSLPQVFVKGKHVGGADAIKQMLEVGELAKMVKGIPLRPMNPCDACDDIRFIPCANCSGSRKVFDEDEDQMRRCIECNENGLVRCPLCCCE